MIAVDTPLTRAFAPPAEEDPFVRLVMMLVLPLFQIPLAPAMPLDAPPPVLVRFVIVC